MIFCSPPLYGWCMKAMILIFFFLNFQTDYLRKISMKILTMETKAQNAAGSDSSILADSNNLTLDEISKQRPSCTWQKLVLVC